MSGLRPAPGGFALLVGQFALRLTARFAGRPAPPATAPATTGWLVLAVATLTQLLVYGPYASDGSWRQLLNRTLIGDTLGTRTGHALAARAVLLVLLAIVGDRLLPWLGSARAKSGPTVLTGLLTAGLAATWSATSHAASGSLTLVAMAATTLHVIAMGVWLGGLISLLTTLRDEPDPALARSFSAMAAGSVIALVLTGVYQAWRQIGGLGALTGTGYGRLLLTKVAVLAVILLWVARSRNVAYGRMHGRTHRRMGTGEHAGADSSAALSLRTSVLLEPIGVTVLLALTSLLLAVAPPR